MKKRGNWLRVAVLFVDWPGLCRRPWAELTMDTPHTSTRQVVVVPVPPLPAPPARLEGCTPAQTFYTPPHPYSGFKPFFGVVKFRYTSAQCFLKRMKGAEKCANVWKGFFQRRLFGVWGMSCRWWARLRGQTTPFCSLGFRYTLKTDCRNTLIHCQKTLICISVYFGVKVAAQNNSFRRWLHWHVRVEFFKT